MTIIDVSHNLNFRNPNSSCKTVNDFVEEVTSGKIQNLVSPDDFKDALCFLVNAIYFAGEWDSPFGAKCDPDDFYVKEGLTKKIPYMRLCDVRRSYAETEEVQVLSLAYKDPRFQFVVVLPKKRFGLSSFRDSLTAEKLLDLIDRLHLHRLQIFIPKFKIKKETPLTDVLKELGIRQIFDDFTANLKQIADGIVVSWIRHKAFIEVDEKGTKAAATTVVKMRNPKSCGSWVKIKKEEMITFRADHPFLFFVVHKKNVVFSGQFNS